MSINGVKWQWAVKKNSITHVLTVTKYVYIDSISLNIKHNVLKRFMFIEGVTDKFTLKLKDLIITILIGYFCDRLSEVCQ
jgi:hypothetical protein